MSSKNFCVMRVSQSLYLSFINEAEKSCDVIKREIWNLMHWLVPVQNNINLLTFIVVVYRIMIIFSGTLRTYLMKIRYRRVRTECIEIIMEKSMVGDWFLMYLLGQNIDQVIFKDVMQELAKRLGYRSKDSIE